MHQGTPVDAVIACLPRGRPATAFLGAVLPRLDIPHTSSLEDFLPGNRADALTGQGLDALRRATFNDSARRLMTSRRLDENEVLLGLMTGMSLRLAHHLNHTPEQMALTIVAAKPAKSGKVAQQAGIYKEHYKDYVGWLGDALLEAGAPSGKTVAVASVPGNAPIRRFDKGEPSGRKVVLSRSDLEKMRNERSIPRHWSIEHIEARGLDIGAEREETDNRKNRLSNLMLMPNSVNWWTAELENLQMISFPRGKETREPGFMICSRPSAGPAQGALVYGAQKLLPVTSEGYRLLDEREIPDFPKIYEVLPVPKRQRTNRVCHD